MITTVNISLPKSMYEDAKKALAARGYASISELMRDALRDVLYPRLTENGFTPEFEEEVLKSSTEPIADSVEWDGKGSFTDFVLKHPVKRHDKNTVHRRVQKKSSKTSYRTADDQTYGGRPYPTL